MTVATTVLVMWCVIAVLLFRTTAHLVRQVATREFDNSETAQGAATEYEGEGR
jgi:hypothetical protein